MKALAKLLAALALIAAVTPPARAATTIYNLPDVGTFANYQDFNTSDTFSGTGFVGIYPTSAEGSGPAFAHLFGLENYNGVFSETEMQVNITGLANTHIVNAVLSYNLVSANDGLQTVTVTSYLANGLLSFNQTPPSNLGTTTFNSTGIANSVNVTALLQNAVTAGQNWFGLFLTPNGPNGHQWTYTSPNGDEAGVRLTVEYSAVPEASQVWAGAMMLLAGAGHLIRRKLAR